MSDDACVTAWCVFVKDHEGPCLSAEEYVAAEKLAGILGSVSSACPVCESPEKWAGMPHAPWCVGKGTKR